MIPTGFPTAAPAITVGELFGPLASVAAAGVLGALFILVVLILVEYGARREPDRLSDARPALDRPGSSRVRPAA